MCCLLKAQKWAAQAALISIDGGRRWAWVLQRQHAQYVCVYVHLLKVSFSMALALEKLSQLVSWHNVKLPFI